MNKFFITLSVCLLTLSFFAQSKKEMIELLNKRVDSLNQIISTERSDKEQLNQQLVKLRTQIKELNATVQNVENEKNKLISTAAEKESVYRKTLKLKQDSLALLAS
jgi:chromosome segregation ATPase